MAAHVELAAALARAGRSADAIALLSNPAVPDHHWPDAWRLLGDLLGMAGDSAGADRAYARQVRSSVRDPRLRQAALALANNDLPNAETLLRDHLREHPTDVAAIRMFAELAARIGRYADATRLLRRALELAPSFVAARHNLAIVLFRNNEIPEALEVLDTLLGTDPDNAAYNNLAGAVAIKIGLVDRAIGHFERALDQAPDQAKVWMSYGHALKTAGRQADGIAAYRKALTLDPLLGDVWWSLANLKTFRFSAEDVEMMTSVLARTDLNEDARLHLAFALGKAREDAGDHPEAFAAYAEGNRLRSAQLDYSADATTARVDRLCATLTPSFFAGRAGQGYPAPDPIFIVGMPRSGSTLVEQILASHPQVEGTQELPDLHAIGQRLSEGNESGYGEALAALTPAQLRALGEEYLERTRIHRLTDRPLFIDKLPNNWQHVGLIRLILPQAKIIDARRHPLACCFSNFKQHFAMGQAFSYDLTDLGRYYRDYVRLMAHIDHVLPGYVHRVQYEDMVADTEGEVRRLLDYIGLPFDPACLSFYRNERAVRTASSEQVRRPIYQDGLEQWRPFDPWLGDLRAALGDLVSDEV